MAADSASAVAHCMSRAVTSLPITFSSDFAQGHATDPSKPQQSRNRAAKNRRGLADASATSTGASTEAAVAEIWQCGVTTVMIRNIPMRYTPEELLEEMVAKGFEKTFDFLYLPVDFRTKNNRGFGFVNFLTYEHATSFRTVFDAAKLTRYVTQKSVIVSPAKTQGLCANIRIFNNQGSRVRNPWFRPMVFVPGIGSGPWRCIPLSTESAKMVVESGSIAPLLAEKEELEDVSESGQ